MGTNIRKLQGLAAIGCHRGEICVLFARVAACGWEKGKSNPIAKWGRPDQNLICGRARKSSNQGPTCTAACDWQRGKPNPFRNGAVQNRTLYVIAPRNPPTKTPLIVRWLVGWKRGEPSYVICRVWPPCGVISAMYVHYLRRLLLVDGGCGPHHRCFKGFAP